MNERDGAVFAGIQHAVSTARGRTRWGLLLPAGLLFTGCYHSVAVRPETLPPHRAERGVVRENSAGGAPTVRNTAANEVRLSGLVGPSVANASANAPVLDARPPGARDDFLLRRSVRAAAEGLDAGTIAAAIVGSVLGAGLLVGGIIAGVSAGSPGGFSGAGSFGGLGRRPEGLAFDGSVALQPVSAVGALFASMAELERASVPAFERLAQELAAHGAPEGLVRRALVAADDERMHTRVTEALARRYGGAPRPVRVPEGEVRSLCEIALENAVEGCVNEGWGALIAQWQASAARPKGLRRVFGVIARDEASHAGLAMDVDAWAVRRLDETARRDLRRARAEAIERLDEQVRAASYGDAQRIIGLPTPEESLTLLSCARDALWS